jgi:acylphosphatase
MLTVHIFISGRVQGVGYRAWVAEEARARGLDGWVRNLRDGRVEAVFCGERGNVSGMVDACRDGPPMAGVSSVTNQAWSGRQPQGFSVLPTA